MLRRQCSASQKVLGDVGTAVPCCRREGRIEGVLPGIDGDIDCL